MSDLKGKKWIWDKEKECLLPAEEYERPDLHYIVEDTAEYLSPVTYDKERGHMKLVSGRRQRREDLKANGCREVDPGEKESMMKWKEKNEKTPEIFQGDNFEREVYRRDQAKRLGLR
jgi:hypothetical protein